MLVLPMLVHDRSLTNARMMRRVAELVTLDGLSTHRTTCLAHLASRAWSRRSAYGSVGAYRRCCVADHAARRGLTPSTGQPRTFLSFTADGQRSVDGSVQARALRRHRPFVFRRARCCVRERARRRGAQSRNRSGRRTVSQGVVRALWRRSYSREQRMSRHGACTFRT